MKDKANFTNVSQINRYPLAEKLHYNKLNIPTAQRRSHTFDSDEILLYYRLHNSIFSVL